jgi:UPF0271 protein
MIRVDLNCDLGEGVGDDAAIMPWLSSASVACGIHAGSPTIMRRTVAEAARCRVAVGAHPSYPDRSGFGRHEVVMSADEIHDLVLFQIGALDVFVRHAGQRLQHVKAHGALYNMACRDRALADAIAKAVAAFDRSLILFGLPSSELLRAGAAAGLSVAAEVFADRAYDPDGSLTSRTKPGSVIHDTSKVVERAIKMVCDKQVIAVDGSTISLKADTICLHGDTPGAADHAKAVRRGLEAAGISVACWSA